MTIGRVSTISIPRLRKGGRRLFKAGRVRIYRTGHGFESGWFGINLHDARGGSTSSLACQTWNQGSDFYNDDGTGFRDVLYQRLGVTPEQVMANPSGVGRKFKYVLVTSAEVTKLLALAQLGSS